MQCKGTLNQETGKYQWELKAESHDIYLLERALGHAIKYERAMGYSDSDIEELKQLLHIICPENEEVSND